MIPSEHACPRCIVALFEGDVGDTKLLACARCGGVWLDPTASRRVARELDSQVHQIARQFAKGADAPVNGDSHGLSCPVCSEALEQKRIAAAEVEIDYCSEHGTWFDRNELNRVAGAVAAAKSVRDAVAAAGSTPPQKRRGEPSLPDGMLDEALDRVSGIFDGLG